MVVRDSVGGQLNSPPEGNVGAVGGPNLTYEGMHTEERLKGGSQEYMTLVEIGTHR